MKFAMEWARDLIVLLNRRAQGHTSCLQVGIDNHRGPVVLIGTTIPAAREVGEHRRINRDKYQTFPVAFGGNLRGLQGAVAIDHHALSLLLGYMYAEHTEAVASAVKENQRCYRIIEDLKTALRDAVSVGQHIKDPVLAEAYVRGIAEEGSITGRISLSN